MKKVNLIGVAIMLLGFGIISNFEVNAAVKLPALIGNNMVLQQNSLINVWGWADAGETVSIEASSNKNIGRRNMENKHQNAFSRRSVQNDRYRARLYHNH
jgi:hypothetical protein